MTERTPITNLFLLCVLAGILLVSGSLQCAFDCLTRAEHNHNPSVRVDECHLVSIEPATVIACANKACHQGNSGHRNLADPQIYSLNRLSAPLLNGSRPQVPQLRTGEFRWNEWQQPAPILAFNSRLPLGTSQQLQTIRNTVLLN